MNDTVNKIKNVMIALESISTELNRKMEECALEASYVKLYTNYQGESSEMASSSSRSRDCRSAWETTNMHGISTEFFVNDASFSNINALIKNVLLLAYLLKCSYPFENTLLEIVGSVLSHIVDYYNTHIY